MSTKKIVTTAMLLAICLVFQSLKGLSVYLTGSAVNAILIVATLSVGTWSGVFIAVLAPIVAFFMGQTPIMQMIPLMIFVVMVGNLVLVVVTAFGRNKKLPLWLICGAVLKAAVLWILVWYAVLPYFGSAVPEKMQIAVKATFSVTQLITALIGSGVAFAIHGRVKFLYPTEVK